MSRKHKNSKNGKKGKPVKLEVSVFNTYYHSGLPVDEDELVDGFDESDSLDNEFDEIEDCDGECDGCPVQLEAEYQNILEDLRIDLECSFFEPFTGEFDYHAVDHSNTELAMEMSRLGHVGGLAAFMFLEAEDIFLSNSEKILKYNRNWFQFISDLTGIDPETIKVADTVRDVIFSLITEDDDGEKADVDKKEPINKYGAEAQKGAAHEG